ncbi:hypothetical protein GGX14DRAFT_565860 [Mycena pura]|uniref:Uncharacterized protein n=1 Tax=Mycena pura TaxID=153505 RepID=A0AAD6VEX4_9AGAR|nr:hypothetical protein GGX14DRAFT_565860 [Mycena pura]
MGVNISHLDSAIYLLRCAACRAFRIHPATPIALIGYPIAAALLKRFSFIGGASDLWSATAVLVAVVMDLDGPTLLRIPEAEMQGDCSDVEDDPKDLLCCALSILDEFNSSVDAKALDTSIFLHREGLSLASPTHPQRFTLLWGLADALMIRCHLTGSLTDVKEAVTLLRELYIMQPNWSAPLRVALLLDGQIAESARLGLEDEQSAITNSQLRQTYETFSWESNAREAIRDILLRRLYDRFSNSENQEDLDEMIDLQREAVLSHGSQSLLHPNHAEG